MHAIWVVQIITFLSAFLLFQIELIIGKIFLPNFGGSYLVWGACIVFFQAALLLGYMYAHFMVKKLGMKRYRIVHLFFVLLPFLFFPGRPIGMKFPLENWPMVFEVFWKLILTIGPAFFVLSTMSIIWQAWLAQSHLKEKDNPYILFAVSNLGSFAALLSYPFLFEMYFDLNVQQNIWRVSYVILVLFQFWAFKIIDVQAEVEQSNQQKTVLDKRQLISILLYGAAGVVMFLAVTNLMTAEVAPVPLFWILPLAIYLLSFVLNFKQKSWCPRWVSSTIHWSLGFGIFYYLIMVRGFLPKVIELILLLIYLMVICLFCQKRIYELKPDKQDLTFFYLIISFGSFLGGIITTWVVPLISFTHVEYFLGLLCVSLAWHIEEKKKIITVSNFVWVGLLIVVCISGPYVFGKLHYVGLALTAVAFIIVFYFMRNNSASFSLGLVMILILLHIIEPAWSRQKYSLMHRNYYGITKILELKDVKFLLQGTTIHGAQFRDPKKEFVPLTYYNPKSPVANILIRDRSLREVAIIGLGTGALSSYLEAGQTIDYFELDPDVFTIADKHFTFLKKTPGQVNHFFGDARISLEAMENKKYDLIVVDAFSGDSIPIHLLTTQAMESYKKRLAPNGIILFHITNRYLDLQQPVFQTAGSLGANVGYQKDFDYISKIFKSDWVAVTWNNNRYQELLTKYSWQQIVTPLPDYVKVWKDEYSNVLPYFKLQSLLSSIKRMPTQGKFQ